MKIIHLFKKRYIKEAVVQETSYIAERQTSLELPQHKDGRNNLFEQLFIFDDHQQTLFDRYFIEAKAQMMMLIPPAYMIEVEPPTDYEAGDEIIGLEIINYPNNFVDSLKVKMQQYIIDYIIWRWLETKLPQLSRTFYDRLQTSQRDISSLLTKRTREMRRYPSFP